MTFKMLQELTSITEQNSFDLVESVGWLQSDEDEVLTENVKQFVAWARNLIDRPIVNKAQIEHDPTVDAKEAPDVGVKDEQDAFAKLAKTIAGLFYFMGRDGLDDENKKSIAVGVHSPDKHMDSYVKSIGIRDAKKIYDNVLKDLKAKQVDNIKSRLDRIEAFYKLKQI